MGVIVVERSEKDNLSRRIRLKDPYFVFFSDKSPLGGIIH